MPNYLKLERVVILYTRELLNTHKKIRRTRFNDGKQKAFWDIPCVAVCCTTCHRDIYRGFSARVKANSYDQAPSLKATLLALFNNGAGKIGDCRNECQYPVGNCAEPHAALKCIKDTSANVEDIYFSNARYVVTGEIINPCRNCKETFPTLL